METGATLVLRLWHASGVKGYGSGTWPQTTNHRGRSQPCRSRHRATHLYSSSPRQGVGRAGRSKVAFPLSCRIVGFQPTARRDHRRPLLPMNQTRIFVPEDESIVARDLCQQLAELCYEPVASTGHGEEAIQLAGQLRPAPVLGKNRLLAKPGGWGRLNASASVSPRVPHQSCP